MTAGSGIARLFMVVVLLAPLQLVAQSADDAMREELRKQEAFRSGIEFIVADLNAQNYQRVVNAIDRADMLERIYGLRLIDQRIKRQFEGNIETSFEGLVQHGAGLAPAGIVPAFNVPEDGARYTLLGIESQGDFGRAVVRVDLDNFQFDYFEFDLRLDTGGDLVIVDWVDYLQGLSFSESVGRYLVFASPSPSALRKFIDTQSVTDRDLYLFGETLKAARDGNIDKFVELRDSLAPTFQRQRVIVETGVHLAKVRRQRRAMVEALGLMQQHYPDEPLYTLMLLDKLFPGGQYDEGIEALTRLADKLDVQDAAMDARLSAAYLAAGNPPEAVDYADRAIELEPGLELAWLSALPARTAAGDFAAAVEALTRLESEFGHDLAPEKLEKSKVFADLMKSDEFAAWVEAR